VLAYIRGEGQRAFQRVESEGRDVTELVDSQTSIPRLTQGSGLLQGVEVGQVVTPNGDGVNDVLLVRFALLHLRAERAVVISFHDLAGRVVHREETMAQSGTLEYRWDGRTDDGGMAAPGVYVCQIAVKADADEVKVVRLVSVAY
jgi:flagellar hook assembly protein FlgD